MEMTLRNLIDNYRQMVKDNTAEYFAMKVDEMTSMMY